MINHGLSTGALFLLVGIIYERRHTRMIAEYGGLSKQMPVYAIFFLIITMSSIGLPALNGFIGEFTILVGAFARSWVWATFGALGIVLGAAYMLWMYQRVFFGPLDNPENAKLQDLDRREIAYLLPIVVLCFWIGLYPKPFFDVLERPVNYVVARVDKDYADQLRAAGTLPTLEAELAAQPARGVGTRRREVAHGPVRRPRLPLSRARDPAHHARRSGSCCGARSPTPSARAASAPGSRCSRSAPPRSTWCGCSRRSTGRRACWPTTFVLDGFSFVWKILVLASMIVVVLLSQRFVEDAQYRAGEYYSLLLFAATGMMFMASGTSLLSIWISLELMALSSYILAGYFKRELKSNEAALKYFVLGALSSGVMLYGISLLYGGTGTVQLDEIAAVDRRRLGRRARWWWWAG